jgi:hypothetical protein
MAIKNKADLQIVIDANLPDNTIDFITPLLHREVEEDLKDSFFNKLDDPRKQPFYINSNDTVSGGEAFTGLITIDLSSEVLSGNLTSGFYETSFDGVTFSTVGGTDTLADLQTWITANVTTQDFFIRAYGVYSGSGDANIQFSYY